MTTHISLNQITDESFLMKIFIYAKFIHHEVLYKFSHDLQRSLLIHLKRIDL